MKDLLSDNNNNNILKDLFLKQVSRGFLHKAAISGQYETVKKLLKSGENVDQRDQVLVISM